MGKGARSPLGVLLWQALRWSATLKAALLQEVCEHLPFALHADLAAADKVVVVGDKAMNILCHLEKTHTSVHILKLAASSTDTHLSFKSFKEVRQFLYLNFTVLYLYFSLDSGTVHPAGYVHCVSPYVILRSSGTNHSCHHWSHIDTWNDHNKKVLATFHFTYI